MTEPTCPDCGSQMILQSGKEGEYPVCRECDDTESEKNPGAEFFED